MTIRKGSSNPTINFRGIKAKPADMTYKKNRL